MATFGINNSADFFLSKILDVVFDYQDKERWNSLIETEDTRDEVENTKGKDPASASPRNEESEFQLSSESPFAGYPYVLAAALLLTCVVVIAVVIKVKVVAKF